MKKLVAILLLCLPLALAASDDKKDNSDPKYLEGAITWADGKIEFNKTLKTPSLSKEQLYNLLLDWAEKRFQPDGKLIQNKVAYANPETGEIAAIAEEYIVFTSTALELDRSRIYYQMHINVQDGQCNLKMTRIRYWYDENRDGGDRYNAEEWINDKMALNKSKTKLAPICGKFRRETIDLKDELFQEATNLLGNAVLNETQPAGTAATLQAQAIQQEQQKEVVQPKETVQSQPVAQPVEANQPTTSKELQSVPLNQLPANLKEMASNGRITVKANEEEIDMKATDWGGLGQMFGKDVAYLLISEERPLINMLLKNAETFHISVYPQGNNLPTVVIRCKQPIAQNMDATQLKAMNQQVDENKSYTMYTAEIIEAQMR